MLIPNVPKEGPSPPPLIAFISFFSKLTDSLEAFLLKRSSISMPQEAETYCWSKDFTCSSQDILAFSKSSSVSYSSRLGGLVKVNSSS